MEYQLIEYNDDSEWAFGLNRMMLNLLGVWPNDYKDVLLKNWRIPFMLLWICCGYFLPQMYAFFKVYPDFTLIIDNLITSCGCFLALAKLFLIWKNRQVLDPLIRWMAADWICEKSIWERELMLKQAQWGRLFTMSGFVIMMSSISCFAFTPFIRLSIRIVNNITDLHESRFLPLQTFYPYDFTKTPYFELTYITQLIALGFAGISFSGADNFFGVLVFHASGQCEILSKKLARLFDDNKNQTIDKKILREKLNWTIEKHVYLVRFVATIEKSFNILILAHTLCLSVIMCCVGFGVVNSFADDDNSKPPIMQIATLVMSLSNMMLHMLVYCTATEILSTNSEKFLQAIYNSNWFLFPAKYSRDVIPLMMRSQYPLRLTVGKFVYLSLNLYARILKTSAGFLSMLLAVK